MSESPTGTVEKEPKQAAKKEPKHTVLHPMVRNGVSIAPGSTVEFGPDEAEHVQDLLSQGMIAEGTGAEAKAALGEADSAREQAARA